MYVCKYICLQLNTEINLHRQLHFSHFTVAFVWESFQNFKSSKILYIYKP